MRGEISLFLFAIFFNQGWGHRGHSADRRKYRIMDESRQAFDDLMSMASDKSSSFVPSQNTIFSTYTNSTGRQYIAKGKDGLLPPGKQNQTSRFFSLSPTAQTLDLGLSFTIPFISIPTSALMDIGNTLAAPLSSLVGLNIPSVLLAGVAVGAAALVLPQVATLITNLVSSITAPTLVTGGRYENKMQYSRAIDVDPMSSILSQMEEAFAEYELDATACLQRAICSYVREADSKVARGNPDPMHLIINGISKSAMIPAIMGHSSIAEAVEVGGTKASCSSKYSSCPVSLKGLLRFLATYVTLTR